VWPFLSQDSVLEQFVSFTFLELQTPEFCQPLWDAVEGINASEQLLFFLDMSSFPLRFTNPIPIIPVTYPAANPIDISIIRDVPVTF
jgi:hypothetical protein